MTTTIALIDTERAYLQSQPLGRLATVDASGAPQINPIGVFLDEETDDIVVGGHAMGATRKFRNVQANAQVALVIDDLVSTSTWVCAWGLDPRRAMPAGPFEGGGNHGSARLRSATSRRS